MLASKDFLRRSLPHMTDPDVGLVQTPQSFYNIPPSDPLSHRMTFVNLVLATADRHNSCPCIGTGWLLRRKALTSIGGGFTYGSVSEDFNTTRSLHIQGWQSRFVNEFLQAGENGFKCGNARDHSNTPRLNCP
jgi:cellulose synthase (UDP-forming)